MNTSFYDGNGQFSALEKKFICRDDRRGGVEVLQTTCKKGDKANIPTRSKGAELPRRTKLHGYGDYDGAFTDKHCNRNPLRYQGKSHWFGFLPTSTNLTGALVEDSRRDIPEIMKTYSFHHTVMSRSTDRQQSSFLSSCMLVRVVPALACESLRIDRKLKYVMYPDCSVEPALLLLLIACSSFVPL